jgi:serralysin
MAFPGFTGNISLAYVPVNGVLSVLYVGTATGGSEVRAFGPDDTVLQEFVAYPGFGGGVQLAAGDPTGTGQSALLTLAVGTTHEKVFSTGGAEIGSFFAAPGGGVDLTDSLLWFARSQHV